MHVASKKGRIPSFTKRLAPKDLQGSARFGHPKALSESERLRCRPTRITQGSTPHASAGSAGLRLIWMRDKSAKGARDAWYPGKTLRNGCGTWAAPPKRFQANHCLARPSPKGSPMQSNDVFTPPTA